ncbi:MAG: alcohol dehydrogenase catalytic domain-containing protein [Actinomycetota bacterium]|nr:alcohol dehydrogenase catalytic domain-containing protein [Actinomycetota bacterium]
MRAAVFEGPGNVRVQTVPDPSVDLPTDAVVRVTHAGICGSDLWAYRGYGTRVPGQRIGHEFVGVVEDVGSDVSTVKPGDVVVSPFVWSDGVCDYCRGGLQTSCEDGGFWGEPGSDGGQGEAVRVPYADGTLVIVPKSLHGAEDRVLPLADVMSTGHHAAVAAGVRGGSRVAVIGDGAVGLCAVMASRRLGAARVLILGHHAKRLQLGWDFGATDVVSGRGEEAIEEVMALTGGVDAVLECVGAQGAFDTAFAIVRDGGTVGYVGVPHAVDGIDVGQLFGRNIGVRGGIAPARAYLPALLTDVVNGTLDASTVFDLTVGLEEVSAGYQAMDARNALKVLVKP